jgi:ABC-type transporter Mla MlaB component
LKHQNPGSINELAEGSYSVKGLLDIESVILLREKGFDIISRAPDKLEFDLSGLEIEGSPAIALLISWLKFAGNMGKELCFKNPDKKLLLIAGVSGVADMLGFNSP